ncbi:MAG: RNA-binding protein [Deltaproteobacteria bacterium]|nr:RNA-binding protein [Deltaproteobacteria bacterium]
MQKKLYVGNLAFSTTEDDLRDAFEEHGEVVSVRLVTDRDTGRPRGFAFVEMGTAEGAEAAITAMNETVFGGRTIQVNEARPRNDRGGGGGGFGGGGGGGFGGGGGGGFGGGGGGRGDRGGDRGGDRDRRGGGQRSRW